MLLTAAKSLRIVFFLIISLPHVSASQLPVWDNLKNLHLQFSDRDNRRITRIENQKNIADNLVAQASGSQDRALLEKAFNELSSACYALFDIYDQYCREERSKIRGNLPPELARPAEFERRARENLDKAETLKAEARKVTDPVKAEQMYLMAHDLELLALLSKGRALRIYQDFPVIYAYQWDDDITVMREEPEKIVRKIIETQEDTIKVNIPPDEISDEVRGITFIVQIAAHVEQIPQEELKTFYSGDMKVNMMHEEGWFKYYLGPFRSFEEANNIMKSLNTSNVFIAAYSDGQRISVNEGRRLQSQD
jgi:hypothetical protein